VNSVLSCLPFHPVILTIGVWVPAQNLGLRLKGIPQDFGMVHFLEDLLPLGVEGSVTILGIITALTLLTAISFLEALMVFVSGWVVPFFYPRPNFVP
jgi:hypothetical protein